MKKKLVSIIAISAVLFLVSSCNWDVWGAEYKDYGKGTGTTSSALIFKGDAPAALTSTQARFSDKIVVGWNSVTGADYYEVYRAEVSSIGDDISSLSWSKMLESPVGLVSYTDTDVESGKIYVYRVRARSFSLPSVLGAYSDVSYGWLLTPPETLSATQGASVKSINISWSKVSNISGYRIYWSSTGYGGTWQVAVPEGYDGYDYILSSNVLEFQFVPSSQYKGQKIYFYIESISKSGEQSDPSVQRVGYTFVEGAPSAPMNFSVSKGASTSSITLQWDAMYGTSADGGQTDYDWEIYRSASGESERKIYSTVDGDPQPEASEGVMTYIDTSNLKPGVEYTYTVSAIGKITDDSGVETSVNGLPSQDTGFLLSPPTEIESIGISQDPNGFKFTFKDALGAKDNPTWTYTVYGSEGKSGPWTPLEGYVNFPVTDDSRKTVFSPYDGDANKFEYFTIKTSDGYVESADYVEAVGSPIMVSRPTRPDGFSASDNVVYAGTAAVNGIYPITVSMVKGNLVNSYNLRVWKEKPSSNSSSGYEQLDNVSFTMDSGNAVIKEASRAPIGTMYYFAVQGVDVLGREGEWSDVDSGYGAITGDTLIKYMQCYGFKPWEYLNKPVLNDEYPYPDKDIVEKWTNSKIYGYVKQAGTGSLTDGNVVTEYSYFHNGRISYSAALSGANGKITFSYNNFGEVEWLNTTGSYTMVVGLSGSGSCDGALTIGGMYPASIGFDKISVSNQAFAGYYTVLQKNGTASEDVSPNQSY